MRALAHESRLNAKDDHGVPHRVWLEASAARGNRDAIDALIAPEYPDTLEYLREWAYELVGTSGATMDGLAPLSWSTLDAWARRTGNTPDEEDCRALRMLDAVIRRPETVQDDPTNQTTDAGPGGDPSRGVSSIAPLHVPAWPSKKAEVAS